MQQRSPFLDVARERRPARDTLLLALAAHFRPVDQWHARERLDDFSRHLFGLDALHAEAQAGCVLHALRNEIGATAATGAAPALAQRHCAHKVGFRVLSRLCHAYNTRACGREAARAAALLRAISPCRRP